MARAGGGTISAVVSSAPLWGAIGVIGGALIGYYQANNKDASTLVIELTKTANSIEEKTQVIDLLISRGLLSGVSAVRINEILSENAYRNERSVPEGLVCEAVWCSLSEQVRNIKQVYVNLGIFGGPINNDITADFIKANMRFQETNGLTVDGIVGARTFEIIRKHEAAQGVVFF